MASAEATPRRRRRDAPSKGDLREKAILDAAEKLLEVETFDGITVEAIARGAGIARNALYFYFASKQEVITALVRRTVAEVADDAASVVADAELAPQEAIVRAVRNTERSWATHGRLMSVAVELGAVIPEIGLEWAATVERYGVAMAEVLRRAGMPDEAPRSAPEVARALCWMTERTFYRAYVEGARADELSRAGDVCIGIWLAVLPTTA
ncbi:TetR/AcrR family transcriptional regulator [Pseudonocardia adelaidensis]|uniref:TetR/AcrR family transcriptional regulator n=1 Tax=Pseudonocardia adelaidensis TaxID=648754 RepID=A0ABP9NIR7_9PSEU